jgi:hypothetical protein
MLYSEMAVHIDGHIASMAHTMLVGTIDRPLTGPLANAVCAAYHASELLCQSLHVGVQSDYLLRLAQQVAADFHCQLMEGPLVTRMERFLLESPMKCLRHSLDPQTAAQQQPFTVEPFEVYCVSVVMTTGPTGKVISVMNGVSGAAEQAITVYQRDVNRTYNLRTKSGRALLSVVTNRLGVFPFSLRDLTEEGKEKEEQDDELSTINDANGSGNLLRLGMRECLDSGQLTGWPAMADKRGSWTAQFRHTCIVQDQQTTRITNTSHLPLPYVHSEFSLSATTESNGGSKIFKNASFNPASIPPAAVSMEI